MPSDAPVVTERPAQDAPRRWRAGPIANMSISLAVLLIPVVALAIFFQPDKHSVTHSVDAPRTYAAARSEAGFPIQEPRGLSRGWHANYAAASPGRGGTFTLRVTYLTPGGDSVQYVQTNLPAASFLSDELGSASYDGDVSVAGRTWQRYRADRGEIAFVHSDQHSSAMLIGDASAGEQKAFIQQLR